MLEVLRRLLLGLSLLVAVVYNYWTNDALISVRVLDALPKAAIETVARQGADWDKLDSTLRNDANHIVRDEKLRDRLSDDYRSLIDSSLRVPADRFRYFYLPGEAPLDQLRRQLASRPDQNLYIAVNDDAARLLEITWHSRPIASRAPLDMIWPNFRKSTSFWIILAGIVLYVVLGSIAKKGRGRFVALDGLWLMRQTLLGLLLTIGFAWVLALRSDPVSAMFRRADWQSIAAWIGAIAGLWILVCAGLRAGYGLMLGENQLTLVGLIRKSELSPSEPVEITDGPNKREYRIRLSDGATHTVIMQPKLARGLKSLLKSRGPQSQLAPAEPPAMTLGEWLIRRLLPGLGVIAVVAILVGFFRGVEGFCIGVQGLVAGCVVGAIIGYFTRRDTPDQWRVSWCFLGAGIAVGVFLVAEMAGLEMAMRQGDVLSWLSAILNGDEHEQFWGYARYSWHVHNMRPGPVGWALLSLLDLVFMYFMAFLLLRVSLPTNEPDGENARSQNVPSAGKHSRE